MKVMAVIFVLLSGWRFVAPTRKTLENAETTVK